MNSLGVEVNDIDGEFLIYPIPAEKKVFLSRKVEKITVFSISGRKILEINDANVIDISNFQAGVYQVLLTTERGRLMKQIVKIN